MVKHEIDDICTGLEDLKREYKILADKHDLPEFTKINELFDIEEISIDTDFLLRKIRRTISERISGYLRFIEVILNPSNSPMFFFNLIKKLDNGDKEQLSENCQKLGKLETEVILLDLDYSEEKEAKFIIKSLKIFDEEIKKDFIVIIKKLTSNKDSIKKKNNGSYLG